MNSPVSWSFLKPSIIHIVINICNAGKYTDLKHLSFTLKKYSHNTPRSYAPRNVHLCVITFISSPAFIYYSWRGGSGRCGARGYLRAGVGRLVAGGEVCWWVVSLSPGAFTSHLAAGAWRGRHDQAVQPPEEARHRLHAPPEQQR